MTREPLLDLSALARRLRRAAVVALGAGVVGAVVAQVMGLSPVAGFLGGFVAVVLVADVVLVAFSALGGADRAQKRGERLAAGDVGLIPARRAREEDGGAR